MGPRSLPLAETTFTLLGVVGVPRAWLSLGSSWSGVTVTGAQEGGLQGPPLQPPSNIGMDFQCPLQLLKAQI